MHTHAYYFIYAYYDQGECSHVRDGLRAAVSLWHILCMGQAARAGDQKHQAAWGSIKPRKASKKNKTYTVLIKHIWF